MEFEKELEKISIENKEILNKRLENYKNNPDNLLDLEDIKENW